MTFLIKSTKLTAFWINTYYIRIKNFFPPIFWIIILPSSLLSTYYLLPLHACFDVWFRTKYLSMKWYFVTKIVRTYCKKKKNLVIKKNFEILSLQPWISSFSRSLEHFFLTVSQNNFGNKIPFPTLLLCNYKIYFPIPTEFWRLYACGLKNVLKYLNDEGANEMPDFQPPLIWEEKFFLTSTFH